MGKPVETSLGTVTEHPPAQPRYALLSVFDKTGISNLAHVLQRTGHTIVSSGGTYNALVKDGLEGVIPIDEITGNPRDSFDGRMKTISFAIEGGILFDRRNPSHVQQASELGVPQIDVVVCNLYPFEDAIAKPGATKEDAIHNIDVGGPTMVRAAAKNHDSVLVVVDPVDYAQVSEALLNDGVDSELRQRLAARAFGHLSVYDSVIARYLNKEAFPKEMTTPLRLIDRLRYGENPDQIAALYQVAGTNSPMARLERLVGQSPSETNIGDIAWGIEAVRQFREPAAAVIKHHTPCGLATASSMREALERAIEADPVSAFGGVVVLNGRMNRETAQAVAFFREKHGQMDIIAAPIVDPDATELLHQVRKRTGIYQFGEIPTSRTEEYDVRVFPGVEVHQTFPGMFSTDQWEVVTKTRPTDHQLEQMAFAWRAVGAVRSNAVLVADREIPMTRGIGSGQTSRVGATEIALGQAAPHARGGILASDSFFPFDDSVKKAAEYEIGAIIQQGSSINDQASIDAANAAGIPMVFTHSRAFRH